MPKAPAKPDTTGLSPYVKFGSLSVRTFWHEIGKCYEKGLTMNPSVQHALPPTSLHGQLMFREQFYVLGLSVPNFDKTSGNPMCKDIVWDSPNKQLLEAWEKGNTGYPYIDALMRQLNQTGWMHHLGRHAVSCFLTRGDMYQNWTHGRDVFDKLLLDADWSLNNGNWLWLAGVAPFSMPYFRVYSPIPGKGNSLNADTETGEFVKYFVPELKDMPAKYIYEPFSAPLDVQKKAGCVIGKDYPAPVVIHKDVKDKNMSKFKAGLDKLRRGPAAAPKRAKVDMGKDHTVPAGKRHKK